jgi:hypothetical protein
MRKLLGVVAILACLTAPAMADMFTSVWYNTSITGTIQGGGRGPEGVYVTPEVLKNGDNYYKVFCIDILQYAQPSMNLKPVDEMNNVPNGSTNIHLTTTQINELEMLFGQHWGDLQWGTSGVSTTFSKPGNLISAAAFQLAVWEIVFQRTGGLNVSTGGTSGFQVSNTNAEAVGTANNWLRTLDPNGAKANLHALTSDTVQDFTYMIGMQTKPVPAPGAVLLCMLGFSLIGWIKRRFA